MSHHILLRKLYTNIFESYWLQRPQDWKSSWIKRSHTKWRNAIKHFCLPDGKRERFVVLDDVRATELKAIILLFFQIGTALQGFQQSQNKTIFEHTIQTSWSFQRQWFSLSRSCPHRPLRRRTISPPPPPRPFCASRRRLPRKQSRPRSSKKMTVFVWWRILSFTGTDSRRFAPMPKRNWTMSTCPISWRIFAQATTLWKKTASRFTLPR